jgi:hypothetical protein
VRSTGTALLRSCATTTVENPAHCAHNMLSAMQLANLAPTVDDYAATIIILCSCQKSTAAAAAAAAKQQGDDDWWKTALVLRQEAALLLDEQGDLPITSWKVWPGPRNGNKSCD